MQYHLLKFLKNLLEKGGKNISEINNLIKKMKTKPNEIRFIEICKILKYNGYEIKEQKGTSYVHFINSSGDIITIKKEEKIKPIYVRDVLKKIYE